MRISDWSSDVCSSDLGFDRFILNPIDTLYESSAADYGAKEDIYAGYLLGRYEGSALRIIGGVRVERTSNRFTGNRVERSEEHTSELQSLMRISYAGFCLKKKSTK